MKYILAILFLMTPFISSAHTTSLKQADVLAQLARLEASVQLLSQEVSTTTTATSTQATSTKSARITRISRHT